MKIAVVGTGYVGLVVGACLAENGNTVICIDKDEAKIKTLVSGGMPIYEPGLEELVRRNQHEERLTFSTDLRGAVCASDIVLIAVGTPQGEDGSADLQHVLAVARDVGRAMNKYTVVVDKSTVPVGTAAKVHAAIASETTQPFSVVSNPEFLKQGAAIEDFMKPDRVVIGVADPRAAEVMRELYAPFTRTGATRRRSRSSSVCWRWAPASARTTLRRRRPRGGSSTAGSRSATRATTRSPGPTRSPS